jgi:hypothetical protein
LGKAWSRFRPSSRTARILLAALFAFPIFSSLILLVFSSYAGIPYDFPEFGSAVFQIPALVLVEFPMAGFIASLIIFGSIFLWEWHRKSLSIGSLAWGGLVLLYFSRGTMLCTPLVPPRCRLGLYLFLRTIIAFRRDHGWTLLYRRVLSRENRVRARRPQEHRIERLEQIGRFVHGRAAGSYLAKRGEIRVERSRRASA